MFGGLASLCSCAVWMDFKPLKIQKDMVLSCCDSYLLHYYYWVLTWVELSMYVSWLTLLSVPIMSNISTYLWPLSHIFITRKTSTAWTPMACLLWLIWTPSWVPSKLFPYLLTAIYLWHFRHNWLISSSKGMLCKHIRIASIRNLNDYTQITLISQKAKILSSLCLD